MTGSRVVAVYVGRSHHVQEFSFSDIRTRRTWLWIGLCVTVCVRTHVCTHTHTHHDGGAA